MVQIILLAAKLVWLTSSYTFIISYLTSSLPTLAITLADVPHWDLIVKFITAAVSTIKWIVSPAIFNFAMYTWLILPFAKLGIYFNHMALTVGSLVPHTLHSSAENDDKESSSKPSYDKQIAASVRQQYRGW